MKVVQHFKNYLNINFHQGMVNACEVIAIFHNSDFFFCFITSERNLSILVKVNHLLFISETCSACLKLLEYKFSSRSDQCSWSYGCFLQRNYCAALLLTSQRILSTLVKANRLWILSKSCSAGPKLLATKFSLWSVRYLWSCRCFS